MDKGLVDQFLSAVPLRCFHWPVGLSYSVEEQKALVHATLLCPLCKEFSPSVAYQLQFLKHILAEAQNCGHEAADEVYELYGDLVAKREEEFCFKSYNLGESGYISLRESTCLISGGTTGLSTWQAAFYFVEWVAENREVFHQRGVLELGSGLGLAGIALCRLCQPMAFCFTDGHDSVMEKLRENVKTNLKGSKDVLIEVSTMDWSCGVSDFVSSHDQLDCIIATDVVYDLETTSALVQIMKELQRTYRNCVAYIVSTVRSEDTYQHFHKQLGDAGITGTVLQGSHTQIFYYDRSQRIELLELKLLP